MYLHFSRRQDHLSSYVRLTDFVERLRTVATCLICILFSVYVSDISQLFARLDMGRRLGKNSVSIWDVTMLDI